jgi:hypothetical protein
MGEGAAAYEQNAMAVDLALIGLDSKDEEPIDSDLLCDGADGQDDWEVVLLRPAAGLPIGMPTLEEHTPGRNLAAKDATPNASVRLSPPPMEAPPEDAERKTRRWQLLQTGVGIATAAAFALLMPDAALMLHEPKPRARRRSQALAKSNPDQPGDL